jgi:hypothetical protein
MIRGIPVDSLMRPLLSAAEADLSAGRVTLALARATFVASVLPEGVPMRVRADGLRLLATQRLPADATALPLDDVLAPMIAQADLDLLVGQPQIALPRLDLVLARLPGGSPLAMRAQQLRAVAASMLGIAPPPITSPAMAPPTALAAPARHDGLRGTGEIVELYIMAAGLGALTGGYLPFVATNDNADATTYMFTTVAGAGLFAVGVLTLDLTSSLPSGLPPTISSAIRFGFGHGMLAFGMYSASAIWPSYAEPSASFSLVWGGAALGAAAGLAIGFGLTPTLAEERFVESTGYWGAGLGAYVGMLTEYTDPMLGLGLTMAVMDAGLLSGIILAAVGKVPSVRRTLFLDLGFLAGSGVGALIPGLYFISDHSAQFSWPALGVGMLIGSVGGWLLTYLLTGGLDARPAAPDEPTVSLGVAPTLGGASLGLSGTF